MMYGCHPVALFPSYASPLQACKGLFITCSRFVDGDETGVMRDDKTQGTHFSIRRQDSTEFTGCRHQSHTRSVDKRLAGRRRSPAWVSPQASVPVPPPTKPV